MLRDPNNAVHLTSSLAHHMLNGHGQWFKWIQFLKCCNLYSLGLGFWAVVPS